MARPTRAWTLGVAFVLLIAAVARAAIVQDVLAAAVIGAASVVAFVVGFVVHGPRHDTAWRAGWAAVGFGLAASAAGVFTGAVAVEGGLSTTAATLLSVIGAVAAVSGVTEVFVSRQQGGAPDLLVEGAIAGGVAAMVVWAVVLSGAPPTLGVEELAVPMVLLVLNVVAMWITLRVLTLTSNAPASYRYLVGAFVLATTVQALRVGDLVDGRGAYGGGSLALWSLCLWAASAVHPSVRTTFEPVPVRSHRLTRKHIALIVGALLSGPALLAAVLPSEGPSAVSTGLLAGTVAMSALASTHLVRQVQSRARAEYRAQHDALTGLSNRVLFDDQVDAALERARRTRTSIGVLFLDLDGFKGINDSLGHDVGDQLLQAVAGRVRGALSAEDTLARMGGDEFTVLLPRLEDARAIDGVGRTLLQLFTEPFDVGAKRLFVTASIGAAVSPDDGEERSALLKHADAAMYRAKALGRNAYERYAPAMGVRTEVKLVLETALRRSMEREELELHYQPKVDLVSGTVVGIEALLRWNHPELGYIPPACFVPVAEESGLILALGEWVMREACRQNMEWQRAGLPPVPVAVNVSARQFTGQGIAKVVECALLESKLEPSLLELELTETALFHDTEMNDHTLHRLRALGVRLSIDDFGTGYSGLHYLAQMPINCLKIDRAFVSQIGLTGADAPIIEAIIALAHSLHISVVAEGVETTMQAEFLRDRGCEQMQGFLFCPPIPPARMEDLITLQRCAVADELHYLLDPSHRGLSRYEGTGADSGSAPADVTALLFAVNNAPKDGDTEDVDMRAAARVLDALRIEERRTLVPPKLRSASLRVAAGTFVGMVPIASGMAAAGVLPTPLQGAAAVVLAPVGVEVPELPIYAAPAQVEVLAGPLDNTSTT